MDSIRDYTNEFTRNDFFCDALLTNPLREARFGGVFQKSVDFVNKSQIKDVELWKRLIKQFTFPADDADSGWRIEYWGKMMRGAAAVCAYSHDAELYAILRDAVLGLLDTQDSLGRITTYSLEKEFEGWDVWGRKYVLLGMQYFSEICEEKELRHRITVAMCRHLDYIIDKLGPNEGQKKLRMLPIIGWERIPARFSNLWCACTIKRARKNILISQSISWMRHRARKGTCVFSRKPLRM